MKNSGNKYWLVSCGVLVLSLLVLSVKTISERKSETRESVFNTDATSLKISYPGKGKTVVLEKREDEWLVNYQGKQILADQDLVKENIDNLAKIELTNLVSVNKDKVANYGLGESKIIIEEDGKSLEIGQPEMFPGLIYVKTPTGDQIYKSLVYLDLGFLENSISWLKKYVTNIEKDKINKVTISLSKKEKVMERKENQWEDEKWIDKLRMIPSGGLLEGFSPRLLTSRYQILIEGDGISEKIYLGSELKDRNMIYWVGDKDGWYWQVSKDDFNLLTGKIN
jgi:hypothetical protein